MQIEHIGDATLYLADCRAQEVGIVNVSADWESIKLVFSEPDWSKHPGDEKFVKFEGSSEFVLS